MATTIKEFITARGITSLFHFTRIANLASILEEGLLTRSECSRKGIKPLINDHSRFDGTNAICATIGFPNYRMFYRLRIDNPNVEWAVLALNSSLLWRTRCVFSNTNAGDSSVYSVPIGQRQGLRPLEAMFDDYGSIKRKDLGIPDYFPTNPQAEVLLLDGASADDIEGIYFRSQVQKRLYDSLYEHPCYLNNGYFNARSDWNFWK